MGGIAFLGPNGFIQPHGTKQLGEPKNRTRVPAFHLSGYCRVPGGSVWKLRIGRTACRGVRETEGLEASCGSAENPLQPRGKTCQPTAFLVGIRKIRISTRKWFSPKVGIQKNGYRPESGSVRSEAKPNVERGCQQKALRLMIRLHSASLAKEFWEHTRTCC